MSRAEGAEGLIADGSFRRILEAAPQAMIVVDQAGQIAFLTRGAERLLGYDREELLGKELEFVIPRASLSQHPSHEAVGRRKDGK